MQTPSGANLILNTASFEDSVSLKDAIQEELSKSTLDLKSLRLDSNVEDVFGEVAEPLLKALMKMDSSKKVREAFFACVARSTYDGEKIMPQTFEDKKARGDYYFIFIECVKENVLPFFTNLVSQLQDIKEKIKATPK